MMDGHCGGSGAPSIVCPQFISAAFTVSACSQADEELVAAYDGISEDDAISLGGTEPFWAIAIKGDTLIYTAPDIPDGIETPVERFAGNGGLSFSGRLDGQATAALCR